jgi:hypothetical protein
MTTAIVGIAFVSLLELFAACTKQTRNSAHMTVATMLAQHVQEAMTGLPFADPNPLTATFGPEATETLATFDDIDDFNNQTFTPPIEATRQQLTDLDQYAQSIVVTPVNINRPSVAAAAGKALRVTVNITFRATPASSVERVFSYSWLRTNQ